MKDRGQWEIQWHPAGGGRVRRLVFTWRGARRLWLALGLAGLVLVAGGACGASRMLAGLDGNQTRRAVDAARRENAALRAQQEALREQLAALAKELAASRVESGLTQSAVPAPARR